MTTLRHRLNLVRRGDDEGVAIFMALAYIAIFTGLMLAMLAIVVGQVKPTAQARKDVGSVNAASSGLQAALTTVRSARDSTGEGNRGRLPCTAGDTTRFTAGPASSSTPGAKLTGTASTLPGNFRYEVSVAYFMEDPTDKDPAWLKAKAMACPLTSTPLFAYLQSYGAGDAIVGGTAGRGNRSQTGVYQFSVPQENIAGGRLRSFGRSRCLDAGASPAVGTLLTFQPCAALGTPRQLFVYRKDLTLFFGGQPSLNLCIQASSSMTPRLQNCTGIGNGSTYAYANTTQQQQEWSFNDDGHFAAAAAGGGITTTCIQPASDTDGAALTLYGCTGGTGGYQAFDPDPAVGAGKAGGNTSGIVGAPTNQYVNFEQFGRCLDVTGQNVGNNYLIAYPCKQAPDSNTLTWNQVWQFEVLSGKVGRMYTRTPGGGGGGIANTDYCLEAPASGTYVAIQPCVFPTPANQRWTATGESPGSPATSYNLVSQSRTQCMSLEASAGASYGSSIVTLEDCNGASKQRWNAPPPPPTSGLNNIKEGTSVQLAGG